MDYHDLDEEDKARQKQEAVDWRNKKRTSNTFLFLMTICEIIITFVSVVVLFLITTFITFRCFDQNNVIVQKVFLGLMIVIFILGLFIGFKVYKKLAEVVIRKMHLEDKLTDEVIMHYAKRDKEKEKEGLKR